MVTPRRIDVAVKWRYFRNLMGAELENAPEAWRLYERHILMRIRHRMEAGLATDVWKKTIEDYHKASRDLLSSMQEHGFDNAHALPVDADGEMMAGSHRLACALALDIPFIPIVRDNTKRAWQPPWDIAWFAQHFDDRELQTITSDWRALHAGKQRGRSAPDRGS
jgi:hypothetical protein